MRHRLMRVPGFNVTGKLSVRSGAPLSRTLMSEDNAPRALTGYTRTHIAPRAKTPAEH
jgi:hypothetical protein